MGDSEISSENSVPTFAFGRNWAEFVRSSLSEDRVEIARRHLLEFLRAEDLAGRSFLDIGCGSGLHSLAALRAGADSVVSFDVDADAVATTRFLWGREGRPTNWIVREGSALDPVFLESVEPADVLYSWGVLHHTGAMWQALRNVAPLVAKGGVFYLALYTTSARSPYWIGIKQRYNRSGPAGKRWMEAAYLLRHRLLPDLLQRRNTWRLVREYKKSRGMAFMTDVRDWLGGWPYEDCTPEELVDFARDELNLGLERIRTGEACTEYLLRHREDGARASRPSPAE